MPQPNKQSLPKLRLHRVRATDLNKLLNALRTLDRTVVEIFMKVIESLGAIGQPCSNNTAYCITWSENALP